MWESNLSRPASSYKGRQAQIAYSKSLIRYTEARTLSVTDKKALKFLDKKLDALLRKAEYPIVEIWLHELSLVDAKLSQIESRAK